MNPTNKIPEGYKPDVVEMGNGYSFDRKGTEAYNAMAKAAKADGISLWVVSAYRSHEKQTTNFNNKIKEFQGMGYTATEAYAATAKLIAVPGTSEHSLGLALDLNSLETSFENTKTFEWLYKNCADYGFILRYPKDKTHITEISYEPWHYRYVGVDHAKIIMEKGICLEEYLSGDY
ncbi:MAG: M15 family metallopeptidase [Angelakisella sp.]